MSERKSWKYWLPIGLSIPVSSYIVMYLFGVSLNIALFSILIFFLVADGFRFIFSRIFKIE